MIKFIRKNLIPFIKYSIVGTFITFLDLSLVYFLKEFIYLDVLLSSAFAFIIANFTSFLLNKFWTFTDKNKRVIRQYIKFIFTSIIGLLLTIFFMWLFYKKFDLFHQFIKKNYLACKMLTSCIVVLWNFLMNKFWTFFPCFKTLLQGN